MKQKKLKKPKSLPSRTLVELIVPAHYRGRSTEMVAAGLAERVRMLVGPPVYMDMVAATRFDRTRTATDYEDDGGHYCIRLFARPGLREHVLAVTAQYENSVDSHIDAIFYDAEWVRSDARLD